MDKVILIGYFQETIELCEKCGCTIAGIVDIEPKGQYNYLGNDDEFSSNCNDYLNIPLVITPDKPSIRKKIYQHYKKLGFAFKTLISPEAIVSKTAEISEGCLIQSLCNVSSNVHLGLCARVNTGANVMHDGILEDFSVVAPNAVLLGRVTIGDGTYIGANSTVLPNIKIGDNSIVGAGAVVTKNVTDNTVVAGVPAKILEK